MYTFNPFSVLQRKCKGLIKYLRSDAKGLNGYPPFLSHSSKFVQILMFGVSGIWLKGEDFNLNVVPLFVYH